MPGGRASRTIADARSGNTTSLKLDRSSGVLKTFLKCSLYAAEYPRREVLCTELKDEEANMKKCIEKLKVVEANRAAVVSELKEALQEQVRTSVHQ